MESLFQAFQFVEMLFEINLIWWIVSSVLVSLEELLDSVDERRLRIPVSKSASVLPKTVKRVLEIACFPNAALFSTLFS